MAIANKIDREADRVIRELDVVDPVYSWNEIVSDLEVGRTKREKTRSYEKLVNVARRATRYEVSDHLIKDFTGMDPKSEKGKIYWKNGGLMRGKSGKWYWPNGGLLRGKSTKVYWPNGNLWWSTSGKKYWPDGELLEGNSGKYYWPNGNLLWGTSGKRYWPEGGVWKS